MTLEFLSCMQTALLSASYDNIILRDFVLEKKICSPSYQQDTKNLARFARAKSAFRKFAYSAPPVQEKEKTMQCSKVIFRCG